jgi:exosome complex component RRP43
VLCLSDDGSLFDAALLAALGALASTTLPALALDAAGRAVAAESPAAAAPLCEARPLPVHSLPVALTCGLYQGHVLHDPSHEEEGLMQALLTFAVDDGGMLVHAHKPGGKAGASLKTLLHCVAAASRRQAEGARAFVAAGLVLSPRREKEPMQDEAMAT